jgi:hypothetical protein
MDYMSSSDVLYPNTFPNSSSSVHIKSGKGKDDMTKIVHILYLVLPIVFSMVAIGMYMTNKKGKGIVILITTLIASGVLAVTSDEEVKSKKKQAVNKEDADMRKAIIVINSVIILFMLMLATTILLPKVPKGSKVHPM